MLSFIEKQRGFTLVEIAIVLLIVTILLGYTVAMFPIQQELKQYRQADAEMNEIIDALIAFAQINGRLPCPDTNADVGGVNGVADGIEELDVSGADDTCHSIYAYLPGKTLGIQGDYDNQNSLLDPWGQPYRYGVSSDPTVALQQDNFVDRNVIQLVGVGVMRGEIYICASSDNAATYITCGGGGTGSEVASRVAAIVISTGKDQGNVASTNQAENTDNFDNTSASDRVYVSTTRSDAGGSEFDDVVKWLPTNLLLSKMIEAGQLP